MQRLAVTAAGAGKGKGAPVAHAAHGALAAAAPAAAKAKARSRQELNQGRDMRRRLSLIASLRQKVKQIRSELSDTRKMLRKYREKYGDWLLEKKELKRQSQHKYYITPKRARGSVSFRRLAHLCGELGCASSDVLPQCLCVPCLGAPAFDGRARSRKGEDSSLDGRRHAQWPAAPFRI